jgi:hypothetical protein
MPLNETVKERARKRRADVGFGDTMLERGTVKQVGDEHGGNNYAPPHGSRQEKDGAGSPAVPSGAAGVFVRALAFRNFFHYLYRNLTRRASQCRIEGKELV